MTQEARGGEPPSSWTYTWEDRDVCDQEPLRDEERLLLQILKSIGEQYNPQTPPPLWENEGFNYNPQSPEESTPYHYCLVNDNQFVFCGDTEECRCDKSTLYYNLRNCVGFTQKMLQSNMGLPNPIQDHIHLQHRAIVFHLAEQLRNNCDKIFDRSIPFVIDAPVLRKLCDAINGIYANSEDAEEEVKEDSDYQDLVLFLSDFCQQTPSLCISISKPSKSDSSGHHLQSGPRSGSDSDLNRQSVRDGNNSATPTSTPKSSGTRPKKSSSVAGSSGGGDGNLAKETKVLQETLDISLFKSLQILELRNTPPSRIGGLNSLRMNLLKLKCSRNLKSISQVLSTIGGVIANNPAAQIWTELRELDLSYNRISSVPHDEVAVLELCPSLESLNMSRNRITGVDDSFSRSLITLSTLNLCYNQLTAIPPVPPNVKVLLLSHNFITNLNPSYGGSSQCDPFNMMCPLKNVEVLDLSTNLISYEVDLVPLKEMNNLNKLNLTGNPLTFATGYRRSIGGYLNRYVISRKFELDRIKLSSSEVRAAIDDCKQGKFIPYVPASSLLVSQANSAMSASLSSGGSMSISTSMQRSGTSSIISHSHALKPMTQSFDSTSSSMRSLKRKKPKIREIMSLDFPEDIENSSYEGGASSSIRSGSSSCDSSTKKSGVGSETEKSTENTRQAFTALREKYGPEHWLLRQGGTEVGRLLRIPHREINYDLFSRSLPHNARELGESSFNNSVSPPTSSLYYERAMANERYTNEELLLIKSRKGRISSSEEKTPLASPPGLTAQLGDEDQSPDFFSCFSADSGNPAEDISIFDMSKETDDVFIEDDHDNKDFQVFRIFQSGSVFKLIVYDGYLMEVNPEDSIVTQKWDLNCLVALEEEKCDADTESVQFNLSFDTMRKSMREKSFIMSSKDFAIFDKTVSPYIEERTLQEFTEALQCAKCFAQFSRAMAGRTVKQEKNCAPREVRICPNPQCGNDILLTLDNIPLPNNECLDLDEDSDGRFFRGPLQASTPVSARPMQSSSCSQSIPKGKSPRIFDFMRLLPSSLTNRKSLSEEDGKKNSFDDQRVPTVYAANSTPTSSGSGSGTATNTKSESDIEVLSTDSSSIEVLGKHCPDSESEVDVEEAIEVPVIDPTNLASRKLDKAVRLLPLSESTSSSSCADSIVTTYEKNLLPISQPLSSPSRMPSVGGSSLCTNASFASSSTLTTASLSSRSPVHNASMPVRYDYVNFGKMDHRLQLWSDVSVFKSDEQLVALTKCMIICNSASNNSFLGIVIFSSKKVYLFRITGNEGDRPQDWLQKAHSFDLSKFTKLDVLIGRHGVGVDFSGKYFALIFRDSERTSGFLEFFMSDICGQLKTPPMVRDFSQTQKMMLSPVNPVSYFGILRLAVCDSADNTYSVSAVLLTNEEVLLITDLSWMAGRCEKVTTNHGRKLANLRQVENLESDGTFIRLIFELEPERIVNWELVFETEEERSRFQECLKSDLNRADVPFICLSQPLDS